MKVEVLQSSLAKALSLVSHIISNKPNLPILSNIFMHAENGILVLAATDLDIGLKVSLKAEIKEPSSISVPARVFTDFVSSLTAEKVSLSTENLILKVKSGIHSSSFNCLDASDFPSFPEKGTSIAMEMPQKDLEEALSKVIFSASTDISRQILTGVFFELGKKELNLVSTDGFRLSSQKMEGVNFDFNSNLVIPARGLQEFGKGGENEIKGEKVTISLSQNENQIVIDSGSLTVYLRLLEGQFPDYKKIIPSQFVTTMGIDREDLLKAVKVASIFARDNANIIHFKIDSQTQQIMISAQAREVGEGDSELMANIEGESLEISFNSRFLSDILSNLSAERLKLEFSGSLKPIRITEEGKDHYYHILMPVRTGN